MAEILPPVAVHLLGDIRDFQAKMGEARAEMDRTARAGQSSVNQLAALGKGALLGLGAAFAAVGAVGIKFAADEEAAQARLQQAVTNTGKSWDDYKGPVDAAEAAARKLGFTDVDTAASLAKLTAATKDPTKAINDLALAQNVARGRGIDLASATDLVVKVETGHVALLGRLGINVKDVTGKTIDQETALRRLAALYGGQASAYTQTFAGKVSALKAEGEHLAASLGTLLIPVVLRVGQGLAAAADFLERHKTVTIALAAAVATVLVPAMLTYVAVQTKATVESAIKFFVTLGDVAVAAATKVGILSTAEAGAAGGITLLGSALSGLVAGVAAVGVIIAQNEKGAAGFADKLAASAATPQEALDKLRAALADIEAKLKNANSLKLGPITLWGSDNAAKLANEADALKAKIDSLSGSMKAQQQAATGLAQADDQAAASSTALDNSVKSLQTGVMGLLDAQQSYEDSQQGLIDAQTTLADKQKALSDLQHKAVVDAKAVEQANRQVRSSLQGVESANRSLQGSYQTLSNSLKTVTAAQQNLNAVMHPSARTLGEAQLGLSQANDQVKSSTFGVTDALAAQAALQKTGTASAEDLAKAALAVQDARNAEQAATYAQADAQQKVNDLTPTGILQSDAYRQATDALAAAQTGVTSALDGVKQAQQGVNSANQAYIDARAALGVALQGDTNRSAELATAAADVAKAKTAVDKANLAMQKSGYALVAAQNDEARAISANAGAVDEFRQQLEAMGGSPAAILAAQILGLLPSNTAAAQGAAAALAGGGPLASIVGGIVSGASGTNPDLVRLGRGHASGGPVEAGVVYPVGEAGREWFVPDRDGMILPHGTNPPTGPSPAGPTSTVRFELDVNATGNTPIDTAAADLIVRTLMPRLRTEMLILSRELAPASAGAGLWGSKG